MNVRFMDTSIIMNLLEIPHMCAEAEDIKKEFGKAVQDGEVLILPMSTIIERRVYYEKKKKQISI